MTLTRKQLLAKRPVSRERVDAHKERMVSEVNAYQLRELREAIGLTQQELADRIGVGQRQVSKIERGDLENARISTIRKYVEAVGGGLIVEYVAGDERHQIA